MTTPKRAPRSGANRRAFESPPDVIDRTVWARPERPTPVITLPLISITATPLSDEDLDLDLGLSANPWDRRAAERAILANRVRQRAN